MPAILGELRDAPPRWSKALKTVFLLARHAAHDRLGSYLAGRMEGVSLGEAGRAQAKRLATRLAHEELGAIFTSPQLRTQETAKAIAAMHNGAETIVSDALDEVNFGAWTGKTFEELDHDNSWRRWNSARSLCRTPAGESMQDVQQRVVSLIERLASERRGRVLLVSHTDVIRAAVMYFLGLPIDAWSRIEISPASVTAIEVEEWNARILTLNECSA
jgi:broad specificity phosphatase PhoE